MKSKIRILVPLVLFLLGASLAGTGYAQVPEPVTASVDRATLSTDEILTLTVTVTADLLNAPRPGMPPLAGFEVVGTSSSSRISIINGAMSGQFNSIFRLRPHQTGDLVIEPVSVTLDGHVYTTAPIHVQVTQGTGVPPSALPPAPTTGSPPPAAAAELNGQDLYVEAEVDHPDAYIGQQVTYTFRFYQAVDLWGQPQYQPPQFTGFWSEPETQQQEYRVQAAGRVYHVSEVRAILFPSVVGPATIEPARLSVPGSLLRSGKTLQTRPVEMNVLPLPAGAPDGFDGAVGRFSLSASLDSTGGKVDEPLTWSVTLSGRGNLTAAPDPVWPDVPGWRSFETQSTVSTKVQDGQMVGSRVYERLLVPTAAGHHTVPALSYTFFDPDQGSYETVMTEPVAVTIEPGSPVLAQAPLPDPSDGSADPAPADIRHLKPVPDRFGQTGRPLARSALYWGAWILPAFGAAGYLTWHRRQRRLELDSSRVRMSQARRKGKKALAQARRQKTNAYEASGRILRSYLADKLDQPVVGLTKDALAELLTCSGLGSDLVERVETVLGLSEVGRYAPGPDGPEHAESMLTEVDYLIDALERVL